ncbi:hypothetical protein JQS43_25290 [Natronosporangium hydrolyticum]|uniref:Uncharacterized protein n=1 Tax=Natronosporangium hydrolyticum TaxID=2811111 RepID=A0A895YAF5_9ACTN|nr:hypothetical protein [Natronosporangium hydrolyticum]QSB14727.1 hypothetical protein JQS43_25290 [Natronosporangium hydrolyticum]
MATMSTGLTGSRYLAAVLLLALLSTVPTLLVVAVGAAALDPATTSDHPPAPDPFVTYRPAPVPAVGVTPTGDPAPPASPASGLTVGPVACGNDAKVGCGW